MLPVIGEGPSVLYFSNVTNDSRIIYTLMNIMGYANSREVLYVKSGKGTLA